MSLRAWRWSRRWGWRWFSRDGDLRVPDPDLTPDIRSAYALLDHGRIPEHGVLTSLLSYAPPGAAWLDVPGAAWFGDVRLVTYAGAAALYLGTLVGIWVLGRRFVDPSSAAVATAVYALSDRGLYMLRMHGPRGEPFFFVWMTYLCAQWVTRRDGRWLAAALLTFAAGMYVFLELAPAGVAILALGLVFRPPVRLRWLGAAVVLAAILWFPYLRFEANRRFVDLRSQALVTPIVPPAVSSAFCDPGRAGALAGADAQGGETGGSRPSGIAGSAGRRLLAFGRGLVANVPIAVDAVTVVLSVLTMIGMVAVGRLTRRPTLTKIVSSRNRILDGLGLCLCAAALAGEPLVHRVFPSGAPFEPYTIASVHILLWFVAFSGVALLSRRRLWRLIDGVAQRIQPPRDAVAVVVSLLVPWAILACVAEHGRDDRFVFLWPVQVLMLAAVLVAMARGSGRARAAGSLAAVALALALVWDPLSTAFRNARAEGWAGRDAPRVQAIDALAATIRATGRSRAVVGYVLPVSQTWGWRFTAADPVYRPGTNLDLLLRRPHGIENLERCAEGFSDEDEYRLVAPAALPRDGRGSAAVGGDPGFQVLATVGGFQIWQRAEAK